MAHFTIAGAALAKVDEVLFVLPRVFPHKEWTGAALEDRVEMLRAAAVDNPRISIASSRQGLFIEIAEEVRASYPLVTELYFLCGRDAAERIVGWDYGRPGAIRKQLDDYQLLVAGRRGEYEPPLDLRDRVHTLPLPFSCDEISATEVRRRIREGEPWEHLVPAPAIDLVKTISW